MTDLQRFVTPSADAGTHHVEGVTSQMGLVDPHSSISQPPCGIQDLDSIRVRAGETDRITLIRYGP